MKEIMFLCIKYQQTGPNWSNYQLFVKFKYMYDILTFYTENKALTIHVSSQDLEGNFLGYSLWITILHFCHCKPYRCTNSPSQYCKSEVSAAAKKENNYFCFCWKPYHSSRIVSVKWNHSLSDVKVCLQLCIVQNLWTFHSVLSLHNTLKV